LRCGPAAKVLGSVENTKKSTPPYRAKRGIPGERGRAGIDGAEHWGLTLEWGERRLPWGGKKKKKKSGQKGVGKKGTLVTKGGNAEGVPSEEFLWLWGTTEKMGMSGKAQGKRGLKRTRKKKKCVKETLGKGKGRGRIQGGKEKEPLKSCHRNDNQIDSSCS